MKLKHFMFLGLLLIIVSGCLTPGHLYIGSYHVKTKAAKNESFRGEVKYIVSKIATDLKYNKTGKDDAPWGLNITMLPQFCQPESRPNKIIVTWVSGSSYFDIGIVKEGPEEDEGTLRARSCTEKILKEHPEFQWEFSLDHRTMAR